MAQGTLSSFYCVLFPHPAVPSCPQMASSWRGKEQERPDPWSLPAILGEVPSTFSEAYRTPETLSTVLLLLFLQSRWLAGLIHCHSEQATCVPATPKSVSRAHTFPLNSSGQLLSQLGGQRQLPPANARGPRAHPVPSRCGSSGLRLPIPKALEPASTLCPPHVEPSGRFTASSSKCSQPLLGTRVAWSKALWLLPGLLQPPCARLCSPVSFSFSQRGSQGDPV